MLSWVWLFATSWTAAHQASLSFTISQSLLKLMFIESVMPSNHLILLCPLLLLNLSQLQGLFQWVDSSYQVAKYWSFSFSISPSNEYSGLISFKIAWFDSQESSPTVQFKSIILQCSAFFMVQLSHPYVTTMMKTLNFQSWIFVGRTAADSSNALAKVMQRTHWKRSWCWERLRARGEEGDRGWIVEWLHLLGGHEFEQTWSDSEWQQSLACCSPWGHKESNTTEWLNWTEGPWTGHWSVLKTRSYH